MKKYFEEKLWVEDRFFCNNLIERQVKEHLQNENQNLKNLFKKKDFFENMGENLKD